MFLRHARLVSLFLFAMTLAVASAHAHAREDASAFHPQCGLCQAGAAHQTVDPVPAVSSVFCNPAAGPITTASVSIRDAFLPWSPPARAPPASSI